MVGRRKFKLCHFYYILIGSSSTNQSHGTCTVVIGLQLGKLHRGGVGKAESTPLSCTKFWKAWPLLGKRAQLDLFILKLCTWYDLLVANNTTCKTNDLIQINRSVFLLLQNYSQAFLTFVSHWWWDKVVLGKSVSKLLLAASASEARLIVVTWYFMFAFGLLYVHFQEWPKEKPLFESDSNKCQGPK